MHTLSESVFAMQPQITSPVSLSPVVGTIQAKIVLTHNHEKEDQYALSMRAVSLLALHPNHSQQCVITTTGKTTFAKEEQDDFLPCR